MREGGLLLSGILHFEDEATYPPPKSMFDCYKSMLYRHVVVSPPAEPLTPVPKKTVLSCAPSP